MQLKEIMEKEGCSKEEIELIDHTFTSFDLSYGIASRILAAKKYEKAIDRLIVSNKKLAKSNEEYSRATVFLSGAIIFVAMLGIYFDFQTSAMSVVGGWLENDAEAMNLFVKQIEKLNLLITWTVGITSGLVTFIILGFLKPKIFTFRFQRSSRALKRER